MYYVTQEKLIDEIINEVYDFIKTNDSKLNIDIPCLAVAKLVKQGKVAKRDAPNDWLLLLNAKSMLETNMRGFIPKVNKGAKKTTRNGIIRTPDYQEITSPPVLVFEGNDYH